MSRFEEPDNSVKWSDREAPETLRLKAAKAARKKLQKP